MGVLDAPAVVSLDRNRPAKKASVLKPFHARLARSRAGVGACDIVTIGTSISEGYGPTVYTKRWLDVFRDRLRAQYQPSGVTGGYGFLPPKWQNPSITPAAATVVGSPAFNADYGLGKRNARMSGTQTITWSFTGTGVDIIYTGYSSAGQMTYSIDGGAGTTFSTVTASTQCGTVRQVRGLSAAAHTLAISVTSGTIIPEGIMVYNGDESAGVRTWDGGRSGALASQFYGGNNEYWYRVLSAIQPSLVVIELGANDVVSATPTATFKADLAAIVTRVRAQVTVPPAIILAAPWYRAGIASGSWQPYVTAIEEVAAADTGLLFFDMHARTYTTAAENTANALGVLAADGIHPSDIGSQMWADALYEFVKP